MSRPEPKVIFEHELADDITWQVLDTEEIYVITYKGKPVNIRVVHHGLGASTFKYKRTSYTELGTVLAQVRRYNKNFNTTDFNYITV
jgi:hypothetical protein